MPTEDIKPGPAAEGPSLPHIAARVLNRPLLVTPEAAEVVLQVLQGRIAPEAAINRPAPDAVAFRGKYARNDGYGMSPAENGVAIIRIAGELVNRGSWIGSYSGMVSYEGLEAQLRDAENDDEIHSVMLDINSPGGEAGGMIALAQRVKQLCEKKRVVAFVNDLAASAAYGIASQASEIVGTPTMSVGSIGVVMLHIDRSGEMEANGWSPTLIYAGKHKVDGHPFGPLPKDVRARFQEEAGDLYDEFVALVAEGRDMDADAIRATEARVLTGKKAVEAGLADRIATVDEVLADLSRKAMSADHQPSNGDFTMTEKTPQTTASVDVEGIKAAAFAEGKKAGIAEANARVATVLGSEEAKGRMSLAVTLLSTGISADEAKLALAASPKQDDAPKAGATTPSIEERAKGAEVGEGEEAKATEAAAVKGMWANAIGNANARFNQ